MHTNSSSVTPTCFTISSGLQQSSISSENHRQGPFHTRCGSTPSALSDMDSDASAQKAGSLCVANCSERQKYASIVPSKSASRKICLPSDEENGTRCVGSCRL
eukprot:Amastigsp_a175122_138.p5 type:complete len:103 gc:universal Amastigsp_a175122_138:1142-1450(+)